MGQTYRRLRFWAMPLMAASLWGCQTQAANQPTLFRPLLHPVATGLVAVHQTDQPNVNQGILLSTTVSDSAPLSLNQRLVDAIANNDWDSAEALLTDGAVPNAGDYVTGYVLPQAAYNNNLKLVQLLVERGADVDIAGQDGETALAKAIKQGNQTIAEYLLRQGAYPNQVTGGKPPLVLAIQSGHPGMVELLLEYGANPKPEAVSLLEVTTNAQQQAQSRYKTITQVLTAAGAK